MAKAKSVAAKPKALTEQVKKETASQRNARRRQLERRDTETAVDRILDEKYEHVPFVYKDIRRVNGKTFREALIDAKRSAKARKGHLGPKEQALIASLYIPEQVDGEKLKVVDATEVIDARLVKAIKTSSDSAYQNDVTLAGLVAWFASSGECNQRTLVGLLKYMFKLNPANHLPNTTCHLACMRWIKRNNFDTKFQTEISLFKSWMEWALISHLSFMQGKGVDVNTWWGTQLCES